MEVPRLSRAWLSLSRVSLGLNLCVEISLASADRLLSSSKIAFLFAYFTSFSLTPLNLVFLFRNQYMSQTASSKFSAACDMENGFAAACDMYLEIMVLFIHIQ